ncbi:MAG: HD domain-containing protein [Candidatus Bathyarchaeia archaeon]
MNTIQVLQRLDRETSANVYLVGGFVRDFVRRERNDDLDTVVKGATIKSIIGFLSKYGKTKLIELSKVEDSFGVQVLLFQARGDSLIAQIKLPARGKKQIQDPNNTLGQDSTHRDFKMNAMYLPVNAKVNSEIIDHHSGQADIARRRISAVGDPIDRMKEHPIRMMRAVSLAARTEFALSESVLFAVRYCAPMLKKVHTDNIRRELNHVVLCKHPSKYLKLMHVLGLLEIILPELDACIGIEQERKHHRWDVFQHCIYTCDNLEPDLVLRLSGLLHDIGKPLTRHIVGGKGITFHKHEMTGVKLAKKLLTRLGYDNKTKKEVTKWIRLHMYHYTRDYGDSAIRRFITKSGIVKGDLDDIGNFPLFKIRAAERLGNGFKKIPVTLKQRDFEKRIVKVFHETTAFKVDDLAITGREIIETFNLKESTLIGNIKRHLLKKILVNQDLNNRVDLIKLTAIYLKRAKGGAKNHKK